MPIYEYECPVCGRFDKLQSISEDPLETCPTCAESGDKSDVKRLVSASSFHLKGTGWYKTDYGGSSGASSSPSTTSSEKGGTSDTTSSSSTKDSGSDSKKVESAPKASSEKAAKS